MLHVADHHFSPGKKQWTWGTGDFGKAWERNLTDEDGPYIELMCGVYTDNQPDFSWLQPNEEKSFEQYFLPYAGIGIVKNATKHAAISVETNVQLITVKIYATGIYPNATIIASAGEQTFFKTSCHLSPEVHVEQTITVPAHLYTARLLVEVEDANGKRLVHYHQENFPIRDVPKPSLAAKHPTEIETNELLFFNGLHLEQYRHATYNPTD